MDGTLLPMDQEVFVKDYLKRMAAFLAPHGYDPERFVKALWAGIGAMMKNDGKAKNEDVFWRVFNQVLERDARRDSALFDEFYRGEFQKSRESCGFQPAAAPAVREIRAMGYRVILATNPLFPAIATQSRIRWAGLEPEDFELITTYENARFCKPNPEYYREILGKLNLDASDCLMVGNDVTEDMIAEKLGMRVFLLTDCLINRSGADISRYQRGSFPELLQYIRSL
ncbi:MAG TPA: HAD family hydrolase [Clostridiales bacterium]|nr:HAD family hydrolase [Clostridiales bacterium]HBK03470.1 HAD family hydrolase [Clostridiales bacterium]